MSTTNDFAGKIFAVFGAFAITATLFVGSFASPNTATVLGVLA